MLVSGWPTRPPLLWRSSAGLPDQVGFQVLPRRWVVERFSPGSTATGGSPRTSRAPSLQLLPSSMPPASCCSHGRLAPFRARFEVGLTSNILTASAITLCLAASPRAKADVIYRVFNPLTNNFTLFVYDAPTFITADTPVGVAQLTFASPLNTITTVEFIPRIRDVPGNVRTGCHPIRWPRAVPILSTGAHSRNLVSLPATAIASVFLIRG